MEASRDVFVIPERARHGIRTRRHNGIVSKLGIDATVPCEERARFRAPRSGPSEIKEANGIIVRMEVLPICA